MGELLAQDGVGLTQRLQTVAGDRAQTAHAQTRAGEGLAIDHTVGQTQLLADHAHLVLEEELERLDQLEVEILRQAADVVMRLDRAALEDVGIDGALCKEVDALLLAGLLLKDADELCANDFALLLRLRDARELVKEAIDCVDVHEVGVHLVAEDLDHLLGLALAQKTMVHMHANQLLAHSLDQQRCDHGGIHTAGQRQQHLAILNLLAQRLHLLGNKGLCQLGGCNAFHRFGTNVAHEQRTSFVWLGGTSLCRDVSMVRGRKQCITGCAKMQAPARACAPRSDGLCGRGGLEKSLREMEK